jgi:TRAP-type C4-dicarboxylate transport system permease small subunit
MSQERELVTVNMAFQRVLTMREPRLRASIQSVVAILCAACFLSMCLGSVSRAIAADKWETWPKASPLPPGLTPKPETDANGSDKAGGAAGKNTAKGASSGKNWWIAAGIAVAIGVGIAFAAGGGGGGDGGSINPGHQ